MTASPPKPKRRRCRWLVSTPVSAPSQRPKDAPSAPEAYAHRQVALVLTVGLCTFLGWFFASFFLPLVLSADRSWQSRLAPRLLEAVGVLFGALLGAELHYLLARRR